MDKSFSKFNIDWGGGGGGGSFCIINVNVINNQKYELGTEMLSTLLSKIVVRADEVKHWRGKAPRTLIKSGLYVLLGLGLH